MDATANYQPDDTEDELFFEEPEVVDEPPPPPAPKTKRKGKAAAKAEEAAAPLPLPAPDATPAAEPLATPELELVEPAIQPLPAAPRLPRIIIVAVALAAIASLFSAVGLLVAVRTVTAAGIARDEATQRAESLARLNHVVAEAEALVKAQKAAAGHGAETAPALTMGDLRRELDGLRQSFAETQAPGTQALAGVVHQGQEELSGRIDDLESRIDAISQRATRQARR